MNVYRDHELQKSVERKTKRRLKQMERIFPPWKLLNWKCETASDDVRNVYKLKAFKRVGQCSLPSCLHPIPKGHPGVTYTQFSAHLGWYCLIHHDPKMSCIIFYGCVTHTVTPLATMVVTQQPWYFGVTL